MKATPAVWLYGSYARGDQDINSDVDVLVVGDHPSLVPIGNPYPGAHLAVSRYTWSEIGRMVEYGSVFLHHLRTEARPLQSEPHADKRLVTLLDGLGPYRRVREDLGAFRDTIFDVRQALLGDCSPDYEMAVLASVARHASVLACFIAEDPAYQRDDVFSRLRSVLDLDCDPSDDLRAIYAYRLWEERGTPLEKHASRRDVKRATDLMELILNQMEVLADDYTAAMST